jgi:hypothetical protein
MNMKRGLGLCLTALALVVGVNTANAALPVADINLSLNLRYTDPADPSEGGKWFLMAKTQTAGASTGIAGLSIYLSNINAAGIVFGNAAVAGTGTASYPVVTQATLGANVATAGNLPFNSSAGGITNIVYGQDLATTIKTIGEGAATPGIIATDPLRNADWANATLLMSGTFAGGGTAANKFNRPEFVASGGNSTDGNVYNSAANPVVLDASVSTTVRGDSLATLNIENTPGAGLLRGDLNRNGVVSFNGDALPAFNNIGLFPGVATWDQGDFNDNGAISFNGDALPAYNNIGVAAPPAPAIAAVPEPATIGLCAVAACGMLIVRRRS